MEAVQENPSRATESAGSEGIPDQSIGKTISELTKKRLTALVLLTIAVGYALGRVGEESFDWVRLGWTMLGASFAATGSAILNQVFELRRDSRMNRTRNRPVPMGRVSRAGGFAAGILCGCLLYTSPSPRDQRGSRMPSSA